MSKDNIKILPVELDGMIKALESDNNKVEEEIKAINEKIKIMDDKVWLSPIKSKVFENLIPYLNNVEEKIPNSLNECLLVIKKALDEYKQQDETLKTEANSFNDYNV